MVCVTELETRRLGDDGPEVTVLGFGAMELRGTPHRNPRVLDEATAAEVLTTVLDEGITFIDTSARGVTSTSSPRRPAVPWTFSPTRHRAARSTTTTRRRTFAPGWSRACGG